MRVDVIPERGAEITHVGAPGQRNLLERFEGASPVSSTRSVGYGSTELDWLSHYRGGWQELFPNAGAECEVLGVPLPFHGEASASRWDVDAQGPASLTVTTAARLPLVLTREMTLDAERPLLRIAETVRNEADMEVQFLWGHHPAFRAVAGAHIDLPGADALAAPGYDPPHNDLQPGRSGAWPHLPGLDGTSVRLDVVPEGPRQRLVYLTSLVGGWYALRDITGGVGLAMCWDVRTFPCLWMWTEIGGTEFPWFGRSSLLALEPATACPSDGLAPAIERGETHRLDPGETMTTWLTMTLFDADDRPVRGVDETGAVEH